MKIMHTWQLGFFFFKSDHYSHFKFRLKGKPDPRISFNDLNKVTMLNTLSNADQSSIWTPILTFANALGPFQTVVHTLSSAFVVMEGNPLQEDVTSPHEGWNKYSKPFLLFLPRKNFFLQHLCFLDWKIPSF